MAIHSTLHWDCVEAKYHNSYDTAFLIFHPKPTSVRIALIMIWEVVQKQNLTSYGFQLLCFPKCREEELPVLPKYSGVIWNIPTQTS